MSQELVRNDFIVGKDFLSQFGIVRGLLTKHGAVDIKAIPDFQDHSVTLRFSIIANQLPLFAEELAKSTGITVRQKINS